MPDAPAYRYPRIIQQQTLPIELQSSICTDTPPGADLFSFGDQGAKHITNTGLFRNGGLTPLYEKETTFSTPGLQSLITKSGDLLQVDSSHNVRINNNSIGNVGPYAVSSRGAIKGYSDAAWSASNTIIGIVKIGSVIKVDEYNPSTGTVINTRSTTFNMPTVTITNVVLVKYIGMNFADSLTFILSNNLISYFLVEANAPAINVVGGQKWTSRTIENDSWLSNAWSPSLGLFAAVGSGGGGGFYAATSPDGITWTTRTLASGSWYSVIWVQQLSLFVTVGNGPINYAATSPDGINWTPRSLSNIGNWNSVCWSPQLSLLVAVSSGSTSYANTSPDGITWTSRTLEGNLWASVEWSPYLLKFVAIGSGPTHYSATSSDGVTWATQSLEANTWRSVAWSQQLQLFAAVGNGATHYAATSPDGITWTTRTLEALNNWGKVIWIPQLSMFCAVGQGAAHYAAISNDGITWIPQSAINAWSSIAWSPQLYIIAAVGNDVAATVSTIIGSNFCWKFAANKFIIGNQGSSGSFAIGDIAGAITTITDGTWCAIDIFQGTAYSRAILSFNVKKNASNLLTGIGEVGYNQTGTYTATPTYYGVALGATTVSITNNISGPGYAEATFTRSDSGTNIYYYQAPIMQHNPGQWYDYQQSQTQTLCNGYGRLSDFQGNALGNTCSLRVMMESGIPTTITAGVISQDGAYDVLGVPITNIGEFDEFFLPHVVDNGSTQLACIYRNNGVLFFFVIASGAVNTLQAVSDNIYMVNTISPINAIDVQNRTLNLGSNDYNGRILFRSSAALVASQQVDCLIQTPYVNSSDTGAKFITQTFSTSTNIIPGIELPSFIDRSVSGYAVNVYLGAAPAPGYSVTYQSFNVTYINSSYVGVLYVPDTRIPFGVGYTFYARTMQTEIETVLTGVGVLGQANVNYGYLGYEIGNDIPGQYQAFILFGNEYLFDGKNIWLATFSGSLFTGMYGNNPIAAAVGLNFIAASPTEIFFLSSYDNAIYTFNGGYTLDKKLVLVNMDTITTGAFSERDDTLILNGTNSFIWVNDKIVSSQSKKTDQSGALGFMDTVLGLMIYNNTKSWNYSFFSVSGATPFPMSWQSAYLSVKNNRLGLVTAFFITMYCAAKSAINIDVTVDGFDQQSKWHEDHYFNISPGDWDSLGFWRSARVVPSHTLTLGVSVGVTTKQYVTINKAEVEMTPDMTATAPASRSS